MITNVWSTPRTGSVWLSTHLAKKFNSKVVPEMFNPYLMTLYRENINGMIKNHHNYVPGSYYEEYYVQDGILMISKIIDQIRFRTPPEEMIHRNNLINELNFKNNLVFHNHVHPIDGEIMKKLIKIADKNIWIYRKDKRAQLASYAYAYTTKIFANFNESQQPKVTIDIIPGEQLRNLVERIKIWNSLDKVGRIIAYEDINFFDAPGLPFRQLPDYTQIFTPRALNEIDQILADGGLI